MCGIVGLVDLHNRAISPKAIKGMTDAIKHRGPDGEGYWISENVGFGHRRLAIIDLSQKASQPMSSQDGRFILTYNGEIYNFMEIKKELEGIGYIFSSQSDSEVLLASLIAWRESALLKLNGMFAFAFYDSQKKELLLARDRYGIKPLYYSLDNNYFAFASEQKAIQSRVNYRKELDYQSLVEYFTFQNIISDRTFDSNIRMLPAGHYLSLSLSTRISNPKSTEYWDYAFHEPSNHKSDIEYVTEFHELLSQAVNRTLIGDVEVGSYLSGGLDSGYISALASKQNSSLKTFVIGFDLSHVSDSEIDFDETDKSLRIANVLGTKHFSQRLNSLDLETVMKLLVWHLEDPRLGQSYPNYFAANLASNHVKVVLSGSGGDELFGGYPWRYFKSSTPKTFVSFIDDYYKYWQRLASNTELKSLFSPINAHISHIWTRDIFAGVFKNDLTTITSSEELFHQSLYFEAKTFLHGLFVVEDKLSMAHGVETRVPFMDNDLVNFAMNLPARLKLKNLNSTTRVDENSFSDKKAMHFARTFDGKIIVRQAMKRFLGRDSMTETKQGFSAPDATWFRNHARDFISTNLMNPSKPMYDFLNYEVVEKILNQHFSGQNNRRLLIWSLLSFNEVLHNFE